MIARSLAVTTLRNSFFFLLHVSEKLQELDESMMYQAQRSANEHGAR